MSYIYLKIITPLGTVFEGRAQEVTIPTVSGTISVLPNHIPLISIISSGELVVKIKDGDTIKSEHFTVFAGTVEVAVTKEEQTNIVVLADRSEHRDSIDVERARVAYDRAKEAMEEKHSEDIDFARFESLMEKELNRIKVGSKRK